MLLNELIQLDEDVFNVKIKNNAFKKIHDIHLSKIEENMNVYFDFMHFYDRTIKNSEGIPYDYSKLKSEKGKGSSIDCISEDDNDRLLFKTKSDFYFKTFIQENIVFFYHLNDKLEIETRFSIDNHGKVIIDFINEEDFMFLLYERNMSVPVNNLHSHLVHDVFNEEKNKTEKKLLRDSTNSYYFDQWVDFSETVKFENLDDDYDDDEYSFGSYGGNNSKKNIQILNHIVEIKEHSEFSDISYLEFTDQQLMTVTMRDSFRFQDKIGAYKKMKLIANHKKIGMADVNKPFDFDFVKTYDYYEKNTYSKRIIEMLEQGIDLTNPFFLDSYAYEMFKINYGI